MSADLPVALAHGGTFLKAAGFQDGVLSILTFDAQHGLLQFFLLLQLLRVGKEVHLIDALVRHDSVGIQGDAPHRQCRVGNALKQLHALGDDRTAQIGGRIQLRRAVGRFRERPAVAVGLGLSPVAAVIHVFPVVADFQRQGIRDQLFLGQPEHQSFRHFPDDKLCFLVRVGAGQHLSLADAVGAGLVALDFRHAAGFIPPCVVDQNFRIHAENLIQPVFATNRKPCQITHGINAVGLQPAHRTGASHPKIGQWTVVPE